MVYSTTTQLTNDGAALHLLEENSSKTCLRCANDPDIPKAGKHRELHYHNIKKSEWAVKSVMKAICNFTNPWRIANKNRLYTLASGAPVPPAVEDDVLRAESLGISLKEQFIKERLEHSSEKNFYDPHLRQKLKTMEFSNKESSFFIKDKVI